MTEITAKKLALRRFIAWFLATVILFGLFAWLSPGPLTFLQEVGITIGLALLIGVSAALLGAFLDLVPRSGKTK